MWKNVSAMRILRSVFELSLTGVSLVFFLAWSIPVVLAGDLTPPSCPSNCTAYADASKSMSLQNGTWSNSANPFFEWSGATDASGIYGYLLYFGADASPASSDFGDKPITTAQFTAASLVDSETYYLQVKPIDTSGNIKDTPCHLWTYQHDITAPVSTINLTPHTGFNSLPIAVNGTVQESHGISSVQWSIDQGQTWNNATASNSINGTSQTTKGDIDDTHDFKNKPVGSVYIKAHSSDNDSLQVQIDGLSSTNGTWETLYSGKGGSGVKLDTEYLLKTFSQIRVQLDDTENNDTIFYDYQFVSAQYSWSASIDQLPQDGTYTLTTRALDAAGNWESPGNGTLLIYDTTPPSNPLSVQGYSDQNGTYTLQNNATHSYVQPSFQWDQPKTPGAPINGYFVYFGQVPSGDPTGAAGTLTNSPVYTPSPINATGTYYLNLKARDTAGNIADNSTQVFSYTYTKDTTEPANPQTSTCFADPGKTSICSNASWSNSQQPTFNWSGAADKGSLIDGYFVYFGPDQQADPVLKGTYQTTASYTHNATLSSGQTYYLRLKAKNKAGLVAGSTWDAFIYKYDGLFKVTNGTIGIAADKEYTNAQTVSLSLNATDTLSGVTSMQLANSGNFTNSTWKQYNATVSAWPLSSGDGLKTVYARFQDGAGNISPVVKDSIVVDTQQPGGQVSAAQPYVNSSNATLSLNATDSNGTGVATVHYSFDKTNWKKTAYNSTLNVSLPAGEGQKTVYVKYQDQAGNWSSVSSSVVTVDTTPPSKPTAVTGFVNATSNSTLTSGQWTSVQKPHFE